MCIETLFSEFCDEYDLENHWFFVHRGVATKSLRNMFFYRAYLRGHGVVEIGRPFQAGHSSVIHGITSHCMANDIPLPPGFPRCYAGRFENWPRRKAAIRRAIDMVIA